MIQFLAPLLIFAEEAVVEESSGIDLLIPETSELIAGLIAFAIIFGFVWKWVLPAANQTLAARQEAITGQLTAAETTKQEAEGLLSDYKQQLADAKGEANQIVEDAKQAAEAVKSDVVSKAETEAEGIVGKARTEAAAEKERVSGQLRDEVMSLSMALTEKVVADGIDDKTQQRLVDEFIDDLGDLEA